MTIEEQVTAAQNVRDALIIIAGALDSLLEPSGDAMTAAWEEWSQPGIPPVVADTLSALGVPTKDRSPEWIAVAAELAKSNGAAMEIIDSDDQTDVVFTGVSHEKAEQRRMFERQSLHLSEYLGDEVDWNDAYAKGGPLWLYLGNRDLVMSMPDDVKAAMVQDVDETSHQDAAEMGRDILKRPSETGPGSSGMHVADGLIG